MRTQPHTNEWPIKTALCAAALALAALTAGCSLIEESTMPVVAKINAVHPLSDSVVAARQQLLALLAADPQATHVLQEQINAHMSARALTCLGDRPLRRFDSLAAVRYLELDPNCFARQDQELLSFYGIRSVGALLTAAPLRPLQPAGPITTLPRGHLSHIVSGSFAREAGVAVLRDTSGDAEAVEIPGATPIARLPRAPLQEQSGRLSPNGQVFAVFAPLQGTTFYAVETGQRIWTINDSHRLVAWLPEVTAFMLATRDGDVMLADALLGTLERHPLAMKDVAYGVHVPGSPARMLIGSSLEMNLIEHTRTGQGIQASVVRPLHIAQGAGITSGEPVAMRSGKWVVFESNRDIGWLDLESGASGTWSTSPTFGIPFAKLDETHLLFDSIEPGGQTFKPWSFDIAAATVAPVDDLGGPRGLLVSIGERRGFMRRGNDAWFGDAVTTAGAAPLEKVTEEHDLKGNLAQQQAHAGDDSAGSAALAAHVVVDDPALRTPPQTAALSELPADSQVHMIGVYEAGRAAASAPASARRLQGEVRVEVHRSSRPVVLVLASYESVNWTVTNQGARIAAVLLSGYNPSTVSGAGNAPVLRIGRAYAYSVAGTEYLRLRQAVAQRTGGLEIRSFQGEYSGNAFVVSGS